MFIRNIIIIGGISLGLLLFPVTIPLGLLYLAYWIYKNKLSKGEHKIKTFVDMNENAKKKNHDMVIAKKRKKYQERAYIREQIRK